MFPPPAWLPGVTVTVKHWTISTRGNLVRVSQSPHVYLLAGLVLPHGVLQVDEPGPVEDEGGHREDEVEGAVGPALVLAAVHQDEVADQEGEAQHDVNISEIQRVSRTVRGQFRINVIHLLYIVLIDSLPMHFCTKIREGCYMVDTRW